MSGHPVVERNWGIPVWGILVSGHPVVEPAVERMYGISVWGILVSRSSGIPVWEILVSRSLGIPVWGILVSGHPVVDPVVEPFGLGTSDFAKPDATSDFRAFGFDCG